VGFGRNGHSLTWNNGCNSASAKDVRLTDGRIVVRSSVVSTRVACIGDVADQERWVNNLLTSKPVWRLTGKMSLELTSGDTVVSLREVSKPDKPKSRP
jgi:heat shock protein HslJ